MATFAFNAAAGEQVGEAAVVTNVVTGSQSGQLFVSAAVFAKEEISASSKSHGELKLSDGSLVIVGENSSISLDDFVIDNGSFTNATIKVAKGAFRFITGNSPKKAFKVETPLSTIGVRGTVFDVYVDESGASSVVLLKGGITVCTTASECISTDSFCDIVEVKSPSDIRKAPFLRSKKRDRSQESRDFALTEHQERFQSSWRAPTRSCEQRAAREAIGDGGDPGQGDEPTQDPDEDQLPPYKTIDPPQTDHAGAAPAGTPFGYVAGFRGFGGVFSSSFETPVTTASGTLLAGANTLTELGGSMTVNINAQFGSNTYSTWGSWTSSDVASSGAISSTGLISSPYAASAVILDPVQEGYWVLGTMTRPTDLATRTGTAFYSGEIAGLGVDGSLIGGTVGLEADFSTMSLTAGFYFTDDGSAWISATSNPVSISTWADGTVNGIGYEGALTADGGGSGWFSGAFFGPGAQETGGIWHIGNIPSGPALIEGVFLSAETTTPPPPPPPSSTRWLGALSGSVDAYSLFTTPAQTLNNGFTALSTGPGVITGDAGNLQVAVNVSFSTYSYSAWGSWNESDATGSPSFYPGSVPQGGNWVIGRATTAAEFSTRAGNATYSGQLAGTPFFGGTVGGGISLNADFASMSVTAALDFTYNGSPWVSAQTAEPMFIVSNTDSVRYNGDLTVLGGGTGNIEGLFYGPGAQETGGSWAIWNVPTGPGGADGVFIASEQ
ncbi:MAG: FecR domain-containing protein [Nitratireductor sp.]